jgi:excisionase family DNA binding protein
MASPNVDRAPRLLTTREVAEVLGVHRRTVLRHAAAGILPRVRVGGVTRYRADDLERILSTQKTRTGGPGPSNTAAAEDRSDELATA